jgi:hypothetical protein
LASLLVDSGNLEKSELLELGALPQNNLQHEVVLNLFDGMLPDQQIALIGLMRTMQSNEGA